MQQFTGERRASEWMSPTSSHADDDPYNRFSDLSGLP